MERNRKDRNGGVLDTVAELFDLLLELVILLTHVHEIEIAVPRAHDRILHHAHRFEDDARGFEPCVGREVIEDMGALVPAVHTEIHQQGESGNQQDVLGRHALSGEGPADRRRNPEEGGDEPIRRTGREPGCGPESLRGHPPAGALSVNTDVAKLIEIVERAAGAHNDRGQRIFHHGDG